VFVVDDKAREVLRTLPQGYLVVIGRTVISQFSKIEDTGNSKRPTIYFRVYCVTGYRKQTRKRQKTNVGIQKITITNTGYIGECIFHLQIHINFIAMARKNERHRSRSPNKERQTKKRQKEK